MKILIVAATSYEIAPLIRYMDEHAVKASFFEYEYRGHMVYPLVTGVGALMMAFSLARYTDIKNVKVAINAGLGGSYHSKLLPGDVVEIKKDRFADIGVEESNGTFTDVFQLGLTDKETYPFSNGWVVNEKQKFESGLPQVAGLTVNTVNGTDASIEAIKNKYTADVESMEGAGFMYACRAMDIDHHQLRGISNMVEPRNKDNWRIQTAIDMLNQHLIHFIDRIIAQERK